MKAEGYIEKWITYGTPYYSAKELTELPGRSVTIKDAAAYGVILTQGYGTMGKQAVSTPRRLRKKGYASRIRAHPIPSSCSSTSDLEIPKHNH
jgi:hypothetical protein